MKLRKWLAVSVIALFAAGAVVSAFNYIVDPFGVFGDKVLKWDSYNMVNNPRVAKIAYLDERHEQYNSYIIGGSKSSSISPELLNNYYGNGAKFYSMLMYGGDFSDYEKTLYYIGDNYKPKNIVLHMSLQEINHFNEKSTDFKQSLHAKVNGDSSLFFYTKYLLLNPSYGYKKLQGLAERKIDSFQYAQFIPETGVYNKVKRDAEEVDNLGKYMAANSAAFKPFGKLDAVALDKNIEALKRMKKYCDERDIHFDLITGATSTQEMKSYNMDDLKTYWSKIAEITDFWDFSGYTPVSNDPRYFYDTMHYRNTLGAMMLGYIFDDTNVYVPKGFGHYTTRENVKEHAEQVFAVQQENKNEKIKVPILVYHHIDADPFKPNSLITPPDKFKEDMVAVKEAGFQTVTMQDLIDYVDGKKELPDNPVVITLDDGYLSNYEHAYPILKELGMKGVISPIGWSMGRNTHRIEGANFYPHFSWEQAREMVASGVIEMQNHTVDMHESDNGDGGRVGVLQLEGETTGQYAKALKEDWLQMSKLIEENTGQEVTVMTYPFGSYSHLSEQIVKDLGFRASLTTESGVNYLVKGNPESLYALKRVNGSPGVPSDALVKKLMEK